MPYRKTPLVAGQIYHVFNRSVAHQPIFTADRDYERGMNVFTFYSYSDPPLRYSHYNRLPISQKEQFLKNLTSSNKKLVRILGFCLMPNHVHFLIEELVDGGISKFMRNFQNSYAKYFNVKNNRSGALFQEMFKAVHIETDEQLIHVMRYIHLNPLTSYIIKDFSDLDYYAWSSYPSYTGKNSSSIVDRELVLSFFSSTEKFIDFTQDQVDYQRELDTIRHLLLE